MSVFLYSYNRFSEGAKALADAMGIKRIKHGNSRFRPGANKKVINWGCGSTDLFQILGDNIINIPQSVRNCGNKLKFFQIMSHEMLDEEDKPRLPEWTTDAAVAQSWSAAGSLVVARTILNGHSAAGLVIINPGDPWTEAPLYTKYVKKQDEYRVHIVNGRVIDVQKKAKRRDFEGEHNHQVRNLANGYIYMREGVVAPDDVLEQAKRGMACSGLDFGACDVLWNNHFQQAYLLEINTAPGLTGSTLTAYAEAFRQY